jgi:HAD superfamily hydrolase (TIGR01509 family)
MGAPLIVLDIGSTLVAGPTTGPAGRIARRLGLDAGQKRLLHGALMTVAFESPPEVAAFLHRAFAVPSAAAERAVRELWIAQENEAAPLPGAAGAIAGLRAAGYQFAVISNIWLPYLTATRKHFGSFFDDCVPPGSQLFSFREGREKPSPELFRTALRNAGIPAGQSVMVGDSYVKDIQPAAALGMRTVWLLHNPEKEAPSLVRVLNGQADGASMALASIADLDPGTVSSIFAVQPDRHRSTAPETEKAR